MPKQLSLSERIIIERMISKDYSFASIVSAMMLEYMDVMDIVVSDVLKIVYAQIFALLMNLLNVLF